MTLQQLNDLRSKARAAHNIIIIEPATVIELCDALERAVRGLEFYEEMSGNRARDTLAAILSGEGEK